MSSTPQASGEAKVEAEPFRWDDAMSRTTTIDTAYE